MENVCSQLATQIPQTRYYCFTTCRFCPCELFAELVIS